jgi:hypothetical protein
VLFYIISHIISYHFILYHIIIYIIVPCHIYITLYYIILYYILCYVCLHCYFGVHVGNQQILLEANTQNYQNGGFPLTNKGSIFLHLHVFPDRGYVGRYISITSTNYPPFSMITFSTILTNSSILLDLTRNYRTRTILVTPPL